MAEPPAYPQPPAYQHPPRYDESWTPETEAHVIYRRPPGRVVVVESQAYYGLRSGLCSLFLCLIMPPLALVPICAPCDSTESVVVVERRRGERSDRRRRRRQIVVRVPPGVPPGSVLQAKPKPKMVISFRVPPGLRPGDAVAINYDA